MLIRDLCFSYGERLIFDGFTAELPDSGLTALAGPSGCGKTTLLRLIAGFERPSRGVLEVPPPGRIAFMFQENRLLPGLKALGQVSVALPRARQHEAASWLDHVGLRGEYGTLPSELSGGMQKRVSLARCLAYGADKELLVLDEPFTGIDPERIQSIAGLLRSMGLPVIYSAHDALSLSLADRVITLKGSAPGRCRTG